MLRPTLPRPASRGPQHRDDRTDDDRPHADAFQHEVDEGHDVPEIETHAKLPAAFALTEFESVIMRSRRPREAPGEVGPGAFVSDIDDRRADVAHDREPERDLRRSRQEADRREVQDDDDQRQVSALRIDRYLVAATGMWPTQVRGAFRPAARYSNVSRASPRRASNSGVTERPCTTRSTPSTDFATVSMA